MSEYKKYSILLVEDETAHALLAKRAFDRLGARYELQIAETFADAQSALASRIPDLLITDINLPDGRGIDLFSSTDGEALFPVVVMTSFGDEQIAVEAMKAGALDYVVKSESTLLDLPHMADRTLREWALLTERKRSARVLQKISEGIQAEIGEQFFSSLVRSLAEALNSDYAFVGELVDDDSGQAVKTISFFSEGKEVENILIRPEESPFLSLIAGSTDLYSEGVQREFPNNELLKQLNAKSYLGTCLKDSHENVIGVLVILGKKPVENAVLARTVLDVLAVRAAAELERRWAQKELILFKILMGQTSDAIFVTDPVTSQIIDTNDAACKNLGYTREQLLQRTLLDIEEHFSSMEKWDRHIELLHNSENMTQVGEGSHRRSDNSIYPIEYNSKLITVEGREYLVSVVRDTTDRKATEEKLAQASKLAAIGELAAGVAHEINNPLANILNFAQLLAFDVPPGSEESDFLARIQSNALRARRITRNLLTFAKNYPAERKKCNINDLIAESISDSSGLIAKSKVSVATDLQNDLHEIEIDPNQIMQVIINILKNAVDAMPQGGLLQITTRLDKEQNMVEIDFRDTGVGMPEDVLQTIFDPFFTTKEMGEGTGLGLSISYGIIKKHNGSIEVESVVQKGSTFIVRLPA